MIEPASAMSVFIVPPSFAFSGFAFEYAPEGAVDQ